MKNILFNVGDIVCLNHSDILLTVIEDDKTTGKAGYFKVCWFNEAGDFRTEVVPGQILRPEERVSVMNAQAS